MPYTPILLQRSLRDTNEISRLALRSAKKVSGKIRARMIESFRSGNRFYIAPYVVQQLQKILTATMLASHLAGFRRLHLMRKQTPSLQRKTLKLSALDDAINVLMRRTNLNLKDLQETYNTRALQILNGVSVYIEKELEDTFQTLVREGTTTRNAVQILGEKFDELGLSPIKPFQLETIFRTQTQLTFSAGKYQAEQDPDIQEILWGYKYVTVGDDRVRDEHIVLEGTQLPKDDPFWDRFTPPNGWNCRCQIIPIFETRESVNPPKFLDDGTPLAPDKDFDFNPGKVLT